MQFVRYLTGLAAGDLGESLRSRNTVRDDLARYFPNTFELVTLALLLAVVVGIPLGMLSAVYKDQLDRSLHARGRPCPAWRCRAFWLGLMLQLCSRCTWAGCRSAAASASPPMPPEPITHLLLVDALLRGQWSTFADAARHAVLPVVTLCFPALASIMRVNRAEMLETLQQDYITTARAQGFSALSRW